MQQGPCGSVDRAAAYGAEGRRFESCHGYVSKRQRHTVTPEASASQLLSELRETNQQTRETMADLLQLFRDIKEERLKIESMVASIRDGEVGKHIEDCVSSQLDYYARAVQAATEEASNKIQERLAQMAAAVTGVPVEVITTDKIKFKGPDMLNTPGVTPYSQRAAANLGGHLRA